ncbi:nicotinate phosphoribosyltransferase [Gammaproteobacteria bacterium]|nr:nicotinate phosphoribosyltransferase [Gammaproteobacteria bacterium]
MFNPILRADSYKMGHFAQYPKNTVYMFDYLESRGGKYGFTRFFGLQYYLKEYLDITVTKENIEDADSFSKAHGVPFNKAGWDYIVSVHHGRLPLKIRAIPEGAIVPNRTPLVTIESTDPQCFWLVGWAETLLMKVWYPTTVATFSFKMKQMIEQFLILSADNPEQELPFKLHDFGYRGVSSEESAGIGGMAHLTNFMGTDNMLGVRFAQHYYNTCAMVGYSVPASEHSSMTSWKQENETAAYANMLDMYQGYPIVSIVADSYDFFDAVSNQLLGTLLEKVKAHNGFVVIRPDSGDAISNIRFILKHASEKCGVTINKKGYKVLNHIRILQGDGINEDTVYDILRDLCFEKDINSHGWSAENFVFGCGGALLQGNYESSINRDTHRFAIKCSAIITQEGTEQEFVEVFKDPITDRKKSSKKGRLDVILDSKTGQLKTVMINELSLDKSHPESVLNTVFLNGKITKTFTFEEVRANENLFKHQFKSGAEHVIK